MTTTTEPYLFEKVTIQLPKDQGAVLEGLIAPIYAGLHEDILLTARGIAAHGTPEANQVDDDRAQFVRTLAEDVVSMTGLRPTHDDVNPFVPRLHCLDHGVMRDYYPMLSYDLTQTAGTFAFDEDELFVEVEWAAHVAMERSITGRFMRDFLDQVVWTPGTGTVRRRVENHGTDLAPMLALPWGNAIAGDTET